MKNKEPPRLTLLSREGCHLCDDMRRGLEHMAAARVFELHTVDVDSDPALKRRYGDNIPVLLAGDEELCRHRFDAARVGAFLARHGVQSASAG